jgi:glycosyl transferase family 25
MKTINANIINLKEALDRKEYMQNLMQKYSFIDFEFITAINGRALSHDYVDEHVDYEKTYYHRGGQLNRGEIGCTLSHLKCYKKLITSSKEYVLILEDDISIIRDLLILQEINLDNILKTEIPTLLFLSGDYWYFHKKKITDDMYISSVYSSVGAYAYFINKSAAEFILKLEQEKIWNVADGWDIFRRLGIKLKAIYPYMVDANISGLRSNVQQDHWGVIRKNMCLKEKVISYKEAIIKRVLKLSGHFESKNHLLQK